MPTLHLLNSTFSQASMLHADKFQHANFTKIPSWVSLKSNNFSITHRGELENVHLVSLSKQDKLKEAHDYLLHMHRFNIPVAPQSYKLLLETCSKLKSLKFGKLIHRGLTENPPDFLVNCVLEMYCACGSLSDARKLFDEMPKRSIGSWVIIISAYAAEGLLEDALESYLRMQESNFKPNPYIYICLLKSFSESSYLEIGKQMHCRVIKAGFTNNVAMNAAVCNMYVKCGHLDCAERFFSLMQEKNVVSYTTMMVGCAQAKRHDDALRYFKRMVEEDVDLDEFAFSITLKACAALVDRKMGEQAHALIFKLGLQSEVSVGTPLVDFYVKCEDVESAVGAFEEIDEPNDVSWSAILCGYSQIGDFEKCINVFKSLRSEGGVLNRFMYTSVFQVCSAFADLSMGSQAHGDAIKRGLVSYLYGESAMITMYAKCGRLDYAYRAFESMDAPDTVAWTAMIAACAHHGKASEAITLFREMQASGVRMNGVTFVAILTACSHAGLVEEAEQFFRSMSSPTIDHYNCMVDVYSRAGLLKEAFDLIKGMPLEADAMSWKTLLGGCRIHQNLEIGKAAADELLGVDPRDAAAYVLLFNMQASSGRWEEAAGVRRVMAERSVRKESGCSWISVAGEVHRFVVGDGHHARAEEVYAKLEEVGFREEEEEEEEDEVGRERKRQQLVHSERLAIAYGLIATPPASPIVVFKNLRACRGCHDFGKHVSLLTGRSIVVRDSNRFHHFTNGQCSCGDYW
ncbi:LOW QUALITY PROTEIN: pentatricopeptide repeat-containing protein At5g13270, chloroplastic [Salvia miltiorrhiza]|uniref:LOW QUALITY PROTEIN: pentatricopeptide repeat-containing protein At5g13270, chloroplastic n=1 Tax=Salvia miltiorrhiza TaxID=226208 RepID=UPI0025AD79A9|nr:LOW QUALITY PROTEIN: pentatricopeptide repeat-containing protein At5g13270, chloroplastic [Salvia miltiorrhiza]